ncbi:hypothetical protein AURDEDRAFT_31672, partial [Auricularia subglabra TFB-10046 SS5]
WAQVLRMFHGLSREQGANLVQLRTGHAALNHLLHRIQAIESPNCAVRCEPETIDHFLLRCSRFRAQRHVLLGQLKGQVLSAHSVLGVRKNLLALMSFLSDTGRPLPSEFPP